MRRRLVYVSGKGKGGRRGRAVTAPGKTVERLSRYRRWLEQKVAQGAANVYSHQLAEVTGGTAAQVRRDLLAVGCSGNYRKGYNARQLSASIGEFLDHPDYTAVVLMGVGNLGRALVSYFAGRRFNLRIVAAFDANPELAGQVLHGCPCYDLSRLGDVVLGTGARLGIIAVPASEDQKAANALVAAGVQGILNFAPAVIEVPDHVFVENIDMTMALEKVACFARLRGSHGPGKAEGRSSMTSKVDTILEKYPPGQRESLIGALQEIQETEGFLSREALVRVGTHLSLPVSKIYGVATFYNQFRFQPKGKYHFMVCRGTACHVKGSIRVLDMAIKALNLKPGQTSRDKLFSLEVVVCMGACGLSPVVNMNGEFHAKVTPRKLAGIIQECREKESKHVQN